MGLTNQFRVGPTTVGANAQDTTSMEGRNGRFIGNAASLIQIKATSDVVGMEAEVRVGQREATQRGSIPVEGAAGVGPNRDTPFLCEAIGYAGEEVFIRFFNTTGGNVIFTYDFIQTAVPGA